MEKGRRINKQTEKDSEDSSFLSSVTVPEALHWVGLDIYFFLMGFYYLFVFVKSQIKSRKKGKTLFLSLSCWITSGVPELTPMPKLAFLSELLLSYSICGSISIHLRWLKRAFISCWIRINHFELLVWWISWF